MYHLIYVRVVRLYRLHTNTKPNSIQNTTRSWVVRHMHVDTTTTVRLKSRSEVQLRLTAGIKEHFRTPIAPFHKEDDLHLYMITGDDGVMGQQSWIKTLPTRFIDSLKEGILYRPEIVNEIVSKVEDNLRRPFSQGLFIKGPQGTGKSHSIVNVVRKLQSTGKYVVTFIPDCGNWGTSDYLIEAICDSISITATSIGIQNFGNDRNVLLHLIDDVAEELVKKDKQWVFVFDQINRLFARFEDKKDLGVMDFPYYLIKLVMRRGRITSIISASANNEIAFKDCHPGFVEYFHRTDMTDEEIKLAFSAVIDDEKQLTGNVPLYIRRLRFGGESPSQLQASVFYSLYTLRSHLSMHNIPKLTDGMCQILLRLPLETRHLYYDRKYFVEVYHEAEENYSYRPMSPLVEEAAIDFFWDDLMKYLGEKERSMLHDMIVNRTANDTNSRIFKRFVAQRNKAFGFSRDDTADNV